MKNRVKDARRAAAMWLLGVGLAAVIGGCLYGLIPRVGAMEIFWCGSPWVPDNSAELTFEGRGAMKEADAKSRAQLRAQCTLARRGGEVAAATAIVGLVLTSFGGALLLFRKASDPVDTDAAPGRTSFLDASIFLPPAGWLIDPDDSTRERWWTGTEWAEARRHAAG